MPVDPHRNSHFWGGLETQVAGDELAIQYGAQVRAGGGFEGLRSPLGRWFV